MELEEMKSLWSNLSKEVEQQKLLTDNLIMDMTKQRISSKLNKIAFPEMIGALVCFAGALVLLVNFSKLDTWYFIVSGVFTISYLIILPLISLKSLFKMKNISLDTNNYKQTLINFSRNKKRYMMIQKSGIYFSFLLVFTALPLAGKIANNKDIFYESKIWYIYLPVMLVFLYFFSRWGIKCLNSVTQSSEDLLKDLEKSSNDV